MSTSTRDSEKFIPKMLDVLGRAKSASKTKASLDDEASAKDEEVVNNYFKKIEDELKNMEDLPPRLRQWEKTLFNHFTAVERRLYKIILGAETDIKGSLERMLDTVQKIVHVSVPPLRFMPSVRPSSEPSTRRSQPMSDLAAHQEMSQEWSQLGLEALICWPDVTDVIRRSYDFLESPQLKMCCLSFTIFPDHSVIKKRPLIYWWIGEGFLARDSHAIAEESGEEIFETLLRKDLIQPHFESHASFKAKAVVNSCTMHPWIRHMLISTIKDTHLFDMALEENSINTSSSRRRKHYSRTHLVSGRSVSEHPDSHSLSVFNVNVQYLSSKPEWLNKLKKVEVLQLGRWQSSATHHIEVDDDEEFLKGLGMHKRLKYLSLRGISAITKSPPILNLITLEILDLRACHNLETLPEDISSLKKLTHLDISECYLLDRMPKGIDKLSCLQVLKGYVIGDLEGTPCRLYDFVKLRNLRRLSIHIGNEAVVKEGEFSELDRLSSLRHLKISWGMPRNPEIKKNIAARSKELTFPQDLTKLDLQGIPLVEVPQWLNPSKLPELKKLYIRGGELGSLYHNEECEWKVEILRLKYLNDLEIGYTRLREVFPHLQHLEKIMNRDKDIVWSRG